MSEPTNGTTTVDEQVPLNPPTSEISELTTRAEKAEAQVDQLLRQVAEYDNARKRTLREVESEKKQAIEKFAFDLLGAIDNLERALKEAAQRSDSSPLIPGVQATLNSFLQTLKRHGVQPIEATKGTPFDPNLHQAVMQQPSTEVPAGAIVDVLQTGYQLHERILRPAYVIVAIEGTTS